MFAWWLLINIFKTTKKLLQVILGSKNSFTFVVILIIRKFLLLHTGIRLLPARNQFSKDLIQKTILFQKQPTRPVLREMYSENMQQIYRRTPMSNCNFNKVAKHLYWNRPSNGCSPVNLLHIFRTFFPKNSSGQLLLLFACQDDLVLCKK